MNIQDIYYHGLRDQVRRVLSHMTDEQIDRGLTAFEDGASNWSQCFFARALPELDLSWQYDPTYDIARHIKIDSPVPVRIVWNLFDQREGHEGNPMGHLGAINHNRLREFITLCRDERRPEEVIALLRTLNTSPDHLEATPSCTR